MWTGLRVLDTATERVLGDFQTSVPFWSATLSQDGKRIYAVAPEQHRVLVIDAATLQELRTIDVGRTPSLALVVP
jgi:YVTN family beta-propeller protein